MQTRFYYSYKTWFVLSSNLPAMAAKINEAVICVADMSSSISRGRHLRLDRAVLKPVDDRSIRQDSEPVA